MAPLDPSEPAPTGDPTRLWLEHLPIAAGVVHRGCFRYLNLAFEKLIGRAREGLIGQPFESMVVPEERERLRERYAQRLKGAPVPNRYELHLLQDGEPITAEVCLSGVGDEHLFVLNDMTPLQDRRRAFAELVRLGASVQRELTEESIFAVVGQGLQALGGSATRLVPRGEEVEVVAAWAPADRLRSLEAAVGRPLVGTRRPWNEPLRRTWADGAVFLDDVDMGVRRFFRPENGEALRAHGARHPMPSGAMIRLDLEEERREILSLLAPWLRPEDLPALQLFGAQITAALHSAATIAELSQRNAQLSALNRVATVAGTTRRLDELFKRAADELFALLRCDAIAFFLINAGGTHAELAHAFGGTESMRVMFARVPLEGSNLGAVARAQEPRVWKVEDYPAAAQPYLRQAGQQAVLSVPMMVQARVVGVLNIAYNRPHTIASAEIEIVSGVGVHVAAAVETNRLVEDLRQSYENLTSAHLKLVGHERLAAVGEMAAALAHEIRNPLGVIANALATLRRPGPGEEHAPGLLSIVAEEVDRMEHLVQDLLVFSRPSQPELYPTALGELLREAVTSVKSELSAPAEVKLTVDDGLTSVRLDARLMRLVFRNLAQNAFQAMPSGGTLTVHARAPRERPGRVRVEFRDTGSGMPPDVLARVFQPFFTTRARGTGLGLALVKRIVDGHHGEVEIETELGRGTRVAIEWAGVDVRSNG